MSGSLAVFKLIKPQKEKLMKKEVDSTPQQTFSDLELCDSLGQARSILNFRSYDNETQRVWYSTTHYTDTITTPIRIFLDNIEDTFYGLKPSEIQNIRTGMKRVDSYQEIHRFDVLIDFSSEEIFVFTNKKTAAVFMKRFKKSGIMQYEKIYFDMSKIDNIPELSDIWGLWEDCDEGRCKKKAYFGTEVHKMEELNKNMVTSYNVSYEYEGEIVDLFILHDCRLSSKSKHISNPELFETYQAVKNHLGVSFNTDCIKEVFEEEL